MRYRPTSRRHPAIGLARAPRGAALAQDRRMLRAYAGGADIAGWGLVPVAKDLRYGEMEPAASSRCQCQLPPVAAVTPVTAPRTGRVKMERSDSSHIRSEASNTKSRLQVIREFGIHWPSALGVFP